MNASTAGHLPPLPPGFGADDGRGAWIGQASDTAFDTYVAAAHLLRLVDPVRPSRRVAWPPGQPPFAVPDLVRRDQPAVTFSCDPEARPLAPFALLGHFGEPAGTAPDLPGVAAAARDYLAHWPADLLRAGVRVRLRPRHAPARRLVAYSALGDPVAAGPALAVVVPAVRRWLDDPARRHHGHPDARTLSVLAPRVHAGLLVAAPTVVATRRQLNLRRVPSSTALHRETSRFYAFKAGDLAHAAVYARRIAAALHVAGTDDFDAVVPVPLSPDRAAAGAPHRTLALADALSRALGVPALELLHLTAPVTKHRHLPPDPRPRDISAWESRYAGALVAAPVPRRVRRILVVDDAVARGCTLAACIGALPEATACGAAAVRFTAPDWSRRTYPPPLAIPSAGPRTRLRAPRFRSRAFRPTTPETTR